MFGRFEEFASALTPQNQQAVYNFLLNAFYVECDQIRDRGRPFEVQRLSNITNIEMLYPPAPDFENPTPLADQQEVSRRLMRLDILYDWMQIFYWCNPEKVDEEKPLLDLWRETKRALNEHQKRLTRLKENSEQSMLRPA
jgi:hypothetical protein